MIENEEMANISTRQTTANESVEHTDNNNNNQQTIVNLTSTTTITRVLLVVVSATFE